MAPARQLADRQVQLERRGRDDARGLIMQRVGDPFGLSLQHLVQSPQGRIRLVHGPKGHFERRQRLVQQARCALQEGAGVDAPLFFPQHPQSRVVVNRDHVEYSQSVGARLASELVCAAKGVLAGAIEQMLQLGRVLARVLFRGAHPGDSAIRATTTSASSCEVP